MTVMTGEVVDFDIQADEDGDGQILTLQVQVTDPDDLQTIELMRHAGVDFNPHEGATLAILEIAPKYRVAVACDDGVTPSMNQGEYEAYSYDVDGNKLARVKMTDAGQVELNGTGDYAVRFNELKVAFDELKADFDDLVSKYNSHTHSVSTAVTVDTGTGIGSGTGTAAPTTSIDSPSSADIDPAKVDNVEVIGYAPT